MANKTADKTVGAQLGMDMYIDPTSCFVYVADTTTRGASYKLGTYGGAIISSKLSGTWVATFARDFLLFRTNNDYKLNAASSLRLTPGLLPSTNTAVSIAGNGSELGHYVHSGMNGFGNWRMKYSSAPTPIEHTVANVVDMSYGADSQCVATTTGVQCKST